MNANRFVSDHYHKRTFLQAACLATGALFVLAGCARTSKPGQSDVPPGLPERPGQYVDVNPRWSHNGKRIAFLRFTPDRRAQLFVAQEDLARPQALLEPALLCPDRPYSPQLARYNSPDTLAWSPDDRQIAFPRLEWFAFEDKQRLPGTGLWSLDTYSGRVRPLALHPAQYTSLFYYYHAPQWSPDGKKIAFVGEGVSGQRVLFVRPSSLLDAHDVLPRFDQYEDSDWPAWEPITAKNGETALLFRQGISHPLAVPPTETWRRIRPGSPDPTTGELWRITARQQAEEHPRLLFTSQNSTERGDQNLSASLLTKAGERSVPLPLAGSPSLRIGHPTWSPDGKTLAFTLTLDANDFTRYQIWILHRDGTGARQVSPNDGHGYLAPVWIGNRSLGALSPAKEGFTALTLDPATRKKHLIGTVPTSDCDWSPDRRSIAYAQPGSAFNSFRLPTTLRLLKTGIVLQERGTR